MEIAVTRKISRRRRFGFIFALAALLYGLTELMACGAFYLTFGLPFSFERVHEERTSFIPREVPPQERPTHLHKAALHPYLGFVTDPDLANRSRPRAYTEYGLLRLDPPIQKRDSSRVIVAIVGGSVATHFSDRGATALRQELKGGFPGKELVLVNLANGGYKQPQQLLTLNYFLAQGAEFDIVINLDGFNEIALHPRFNAEMGVSPLYPVNWRLLANIPDANERSLFAVAAVHHHEKRSLAKQFSRSPLRYSVTANYVWKYLDRQQERAIAECQSAMMARRSEGTFQQRGPRGLPDAEDTDEELVAIWQRCSLQLDRLCRANGIRYHHFLQPNQYVPGSKEMKAEERARAFLDHHVMKTSVEKCYPKLRSAGKELANQGVRFHDLTMIFAGEPEPIYHDSCCHINQHGNEIMAGQIARAILATPEPPMAPPLAN